MDVLRCPDTLFVKALTPFAGDSSWFPLPPVPGASDFQLLSERCCACVHSQQLGCTLYLQNFFFFLCSLGLATWRYLKSTVWSSYFGSHLLSGFWAFRPMCHLLDYELFIDARILELEKKCRFIFNGGGAERWAGNHSSDLWAQCPLYSHAIPETWLENLPTAKGPTSSPKGTPSPTGSTSCNLWG